MTELELSQTDLADRSGLDRLQIHRILNSKTRPDAAHLTALLAAFTDPAHQFVLVRAHIQDELPTDAFKALDFHLRNHSAQENSLIGLEALPPHIAAAVRHLIEIYAENTAIGDVFVDLARASGYKADSIRVGKITKYPRK